MMAGYARSLSLQGEDPDRIQGSVGLLQTAVEDRRSQSGPAVGLACGHRSEPHVETVADALAIAREAGVEVSLEQATEDGLPILQVDICHAYSVLARACLSTPIRIQGDANRMGLSFWLKP